MNVRVFGVSLELDEARLRVAPTEVRRQVAAYERSGPGEWNGFDVGVSYFEGFVGRVTRELARIPLGETRTYGEIARRLDTAPIAVGGACGRNPVPLIVPCHRVVGTESLGGYSAGGERGRALKRRLLAHERALAGSTETEPDRA